MKALIDADVIRYRYGFAAQKKKDDVLIVEPEYVVIKAVEVGLSAIINAVEADDYVCYLSGKGNFRMEVDPDYKANRKDSEKPYHYNNIGSYLMFCHDAEVVDGMEADDAIAIAQTASRARRYPNGDAKGTASADINAVIDETIICSNDKDMDQVPGWHYDFVKKHKYYVTPEEAQHYFYCQMLTGDAVDNIKGIHRVGPKTAEKMLAECVSEVDYENAVYEAYKKAFGDEAHAMYDKNKQLLGLRTH